MKINDKCATCAHNLDKAGLDCELYCAEATETETDDDGIVYVTSCGDYLKDKVQKI